MCWGHGTWGLQAVPGGSGLCPAGTEGTTTAVAGTEAELHVQLMRMSGPGWSWVLGPSVGAWGAPKANRVLTQHPTPASPRHPRLLLLPPECLNSCKQRRREIRTSLGLFVLSTQY